MAKYILDGRYKDLLLYHGISPAMVLEAAGLPGTALDGRVLRLSEKDYYRLMNAIGETVPDPRLPLLLSCTDKIETFCAPLFAAFCARDGAACIKRLARYKRLIGPMKFTTAVERDTMSVTITATDPALEVPLFLISCEFAFLTGLLRRASHEHIRPVSVCTRCELNNDELLRFLDSPARLSDENEIVFSLHDLHVPFVSSNQNLTDYLDPELNKRLSGLDSVQSVSMQVRDALEDLLAGGCSIDDVAEKLGMSKRTLQRRLHEEHTTFGAELSGLRATLSFHYVTETDMSINDISFMLGFTEVNSFLRAFRAMHGKTVTACRESAPRN